MSVCNYRTPAFRFYSYASVAFADSSLISSGLLVPSTSPGEIVAAANVYSTTLAFFSTALVPKRLMSSFSYLVLKACR